VEVVDCAQDITVRASRIAIRLRFVGKSPWELMLLVEMGARMSEGTLRARGLIQTVIRSRSDTENRAEL
jgi:hypothetical protein